MPLLTPESPNLGHTLQNVLWGSQVKLTAHPEADCVVGTEPGSSAAQRPLYWHIQPILPPEMFNGVVAVAAEIVRETLQHSKNIFPVLPLLQKEKRVMPMQATETKSNVSLVFAAVLKTLT